MTLLEELKSVLKKDKRLVSRGKLLKNKIMELTFKQDKKLLKLLLSEDRTKEHFFTDVDGTLVFDKDKFVRFVNNKQFLPDSYTTFKIKIGLTEDGEYLDKKKEVVLAWPYKDCVLEGGMKREDEGRNEIFHNEILAPDEIDKLLEPKVLTNFKRIDSRGEHKIKEIKPTDNLIIKGNNLLALHSLKKRFARKIKLIYIDPNWNRDADTFYNDKFKHSTWLTFMKNRLEITKELLREYGCIFVHLDDTELAYCKILLDEVFGRENYCNHIIISTNKPFGFKGTAKSLFKQANHVLFYSKDKNLIGLEKIFIETAYDPAYNLVFDDVSKPESEWKWMNITKAVAKELGHSSVREARKALGKKGFEEEIAKFALNNAHRVFQTAAVSGGAYIKRKKTIEKSKKKRDKIIRHPHDDMDYMFIGGRRVLFYKERIVEINDHLLPGELITDIWTDISLEGLAKEGGVSFAKSKKPEKLVHRIIELIADKKEDIVLDFFLGSGTTAAVAHKLSHQYIGIEQLDYGDEDCIVRLKNVINGDKTGISKTVNWKGGGDFVYCELKQLNEQFVQKIKNAKDTRELQNIWQEMKKNSFLSYKIDPKDIDENAKDFDNLSLKNQKRFLIECLDKNDLYVNYSEIDDKEYGVSKEDKKMNKQFYGGLNA
jgi:adenine-specific DNA-methyltransferase